MDHDRFMEVAAAFLAGLWCGLFVAAIAVARLQ